MQIKSLEEIEKEKALKESTPSVVKLDAPLAAAPARKAPRPGRSPRTVPPSVSAVTIPPLLTKVILTYFILFTNFIIKRLPKSQLVYSMSQGLQLGTARSENFIKR